MDNLEIEPPIMYLGIVFVAILQILKNTADNNREYVKEDNRKSKLKTSKNSSKRL